MKRVLYFIGHYDYLIYGLLHESPLTEEDTTADFIVLETKNSAETVRFLQKKASGGTELGRFALVNDEAFLDKASMEDTLAAVISAYKKIFERFGLQPGQYAHIYLSFDEWNSFGIYLEHCKGLPPVTVFLRDVNQPSLNIYSYLDSPGKYHFSQLQRKYRVLSGEAEYITDYIVLDEDNTENRLNRRPVQSFSLKGKINGLDRDKFGKLCEFFHAEPEKNVSLTDDGVLLVMDSYWFEQPKSKGSYDYVRMYLTFLDYAGVSGHRAVLKQHPRYSIPEVLRENFANIELIDGYIPVELFAYEASPEFNGI